ncbi:GNAT family N-acetyltransferase [Chitinophaga tropicalis]|uniref:GNAT family N-acetyltransferase n=1 Tax=Chitinophaga tropicalis TaxID=2683588 RepID=A0A7K1UDS5_9BACT|nr:GNAT family N-acetyltransferase [Chitinophaga tropicalis]MVT12531.1 GNAT family N-acetyltransferase [Chitinophaga tropicalis]
MTEEIEYRICSKDDTPQLIDIAVQSYQEHYTHLWHDGGKQYMETNLSHEQLSKEIENANSIFFLVNLDKTPVGIVKLNVDKSIDEYTAKEALELERIYFLKVASGRGLGKATLFMVTNFAKQREKKIVWLKAMKGSKAEAFYQKQGFTIKNETVLDYPFIKEEYKEMVIMLKIL